ncbi:ATP-binding cassette domain-containing protein [Gammaproteobacteria bacterium AS21]
MQVQEKLVEMIDIEKRFGGVKAVDKVNINLYSAEVVAVLGHNGAGKSTLMSMLAGAFPCDEGRIVIDGVDVSIETPLDAREKGVECIYQNLALADNLNSPENLFLGRELMTPFNTLDDDEMECQAREVLHRLNPNFKNIIDPVKSLSGGQRQSVAIARAILFNARILILDEPTAALGPQETEMVAKLILKLKLQGIGIFLISHDLPDVFKLADRVSVMKNGALVGTYHIDDVNQDEVLAMIISGKKPAADECLEYRVK